MSLTRTHIAFLGIISIFTGLVGPGTRAQDTLLSYLMTDMRAIAYGVLIALILAFVLASTRKWALYRMSVTLTIIGIAALGVLTLLGKISSMKTGEVASGLSWGWIFLIVGVVLLLVSYRRLDITQEETQFSDAIDTIIGMVGGFALACIAGILILSSLSYFGKSQSHEILSRSYLSGEIVVLSGGIRSVGLYESEPILAYDRGEDRLLVATVGGSGTIWRLADKGSVSTGSLKAGQSLVEIGSIVYGREPSGMISSGGTLLLGSRLSSSERAVIRKEGGVIHIDSKLGSRVLDYRGILAPPIVLSRDTSTLVWTESSSGGKLIMKNGTPLGAPVEKVLDIALSTNGQSVTALVYVSGAENIVKNGTPVGTLPTSYMSGSYRSNGSHFIYTTEEKGVKKVIHDMEVVSRDLAEVREVWLETDGGSYAYFGRPVGESRYCLFTRYKGNLCGLEGYMNPILSADGASIIFAGKKDRIWSIYRGTDIIVKNTGYTASDIDYDYAYFDATNPRTYLFIERDPKSGEYRYRKNSVLLPGTWQDISTKVYFGYDNHILTIAKDKSGWRVIEL